MGYLDNSGLSHVITKLKALIASKQDTLVSGTNIKTVNGASLLGSGNVTISGGGVVDANELIIFRECATTTTSVSSGSCIEVTATVPTVSGYTRKGIVQTWTTGTGNTIVGSQSLSGSNARAKVRANDTASVVVHFYIMYTKDS